MFETEADRLALIRGAGGESVRVDGRDVLVIFTDEHVPMSFGDYVVDGSSPQIHGRTSDFANVNDTTVITVRDNQYNPASVEPDGTGMTTIRLREI